MKLLRKDKETSTRGKWVEFLEQFLHLIKHKKGKNKVISYVLSHRYALLSTIETKFLCFDCINELYEHDTNFSNKYQTSSHTSSYG